MSLKVGIIRCQQTEDYCPATTCLMCAAKGEGGFKDTGPVEVIGLVTCGGCPGKRAIGRALELKRRGAEAIVLASCISKGSPSYIGFPCPFSDVIKSILDEKVSLEVIGWTH